MRRLRLISGSIPALRILLPTIPLTCLGRRTEQGKVVYEPKAAESVVKVPFLVRVKISDLNIRKGPGTNYDRVQFCPPGIYTVIATSKGAGASLWGKLKSGIGWIALEYTVRL